jgi:hypothetical protein
LVRLARARLEDFDIPLPHSREELVDFLQGPPGTLLRILYTEGDDGLAKIANKALKRDDK